MTRTYDYQYDLYKQNFFSLPLDSDRSVTVKIKKASNLQRLAGFSIKLNKYGRPGDISFAVGVGPCDDSIAFGTIRAETVLPVYEGFVRVDFPPVNIGGDFFITLRAGAGVLPLDGYRVFGPGQDDSDIFDEAEVPPYWWDEKFSFGMAVPGYYKPQKHEKSSFSCTVDEAGGEGPSISLRLYSEACEEDPEPDAFSFLKKLFAPKYSEWQRLTPVQEPLPGEVILDSGWAIAWDPKLPSSRLTENMKEEAEEFLERCFGIKLVNITLREPSSESSSMPAFMQRDILRFHTDATLDVKGHEGHTIEVSPGTITILAKNPNGLLGGLRFIEDVMLEKGYPALAAGKYQRDSLYDLRMTSGIYPAPYNYFPLQTGEIWNDGYMWRLSRSGFNAAWCIANLEELTADSKVLPGFGSRSASAALERLRRITELGEAYGVDFYIDLKTGYFGRFDESIYERHPELKTFNKWGNYPCTGVGTFRELLAELITGLVTEAPLLKGLMIIYDSEGFYSCFNHHRQQECPNCRDKTPQELAAVLFGDLLKNVRRSRKDAQIIAWTYYCDEQWNYDLIGSLPEGIVMLSCFSQFVPFERYGVVTRTDDYACCVTGPGDYFEKVSRVSHEKGMPIIAKTELSQGQEFVTVPYIPSLTQHQERWDKLREYGLAGFMGDYIHSNFKPSPCTDLMRSNLFDTRKDGAIWQDAEAKLRFTAGLNYGRASAAAVADAWRLFSQALCEDFPYSPGVCRYPGPLQAGPTQPFYTDSGRKLKRVSSRCNCPDLSWTELYFTEMGEYGRNPRWDAALVRRCLSDFERKFREGIELLEAEMPMCSRKEALLELIEIASVMRCMVISMINFIDFAKLRDKSPEKTPGERYAGMLAACEAELGNVEAAGLLCLNNPQLGFSCEGQGTVRGGLFNIHTINSKKFELCETIDELRKKIAAISY